MQIKRRYFLPHFFTFYIYLFVPKHFLFFNASLVMIKREYFFYVTSNLENVCVLSIFFFIHKKCGKFFFPTKMIQRDKKINKRMKNEIQYTSKTFEHKRCHQQNKEIIISTLHFTSKFISFKLNF